MQYLPQLTAAIGAVLLCIPGPVQAAGPHACTDAAVAQAQKLLRFHLGDLANDVSIGDSETATVRAPVKALKGKSKFDVLEVTSDVIKTKYRMRLIYARMEGCVLMGQEIFEASNPG